jgi:hypothetical protein
MDPQFAISFAKTPAIQTEQGSLSPALGGPAVLRIRANAATQRKTG